MHGLIQMVARVTGKLHQGDRVRHKRWNVLGTVFMLREDAHWPTAVVIWDDKTDAPEVVYLASLEVDK